MNTEALISITAFTILTLLWLAFVLALLFNRVMLDRAWRAFRSWPVLVQVIVGLLALPVALGLWVWQARWPMLLRLALVLGLALVTIYTFYPAAAAALQ